ASYGGRARGRWGTSPIDGSKARWESGTHSPTGTGGIPMNDETPAIEHPDEDDRTGPRPRRLMRSSRDRVVAGVAGGLGRYFGVDPLLFRIGFVLSLFFGGLGAFAYVLLALFVATDGVPDRVQRLGRRLLRTGFLRGLAAAEF